MSKRERDGSGETEREGGSGRRKREIENRRVHDGALHAHTDRDLRAVSGNRE